MRNLKLCFLAILTMGFFMTISCSKKGDTGPAGPAGPDSVLYSSWTALSMSIAYDQSGDSAYTASITAPKITSKVMNTSTIVGYLMVPDPLTGDSSAVNAINYMQEYFTPGYIDLVAGGDLTGVPYRYVIIPSKISITGSDGTVQTYSGDQISKLDYTTLTGLLKIPTKGSGSKQLSIQ